VAVWPYDKERDQNGRREDLVGACSNLDGNDRAHQHQQMSVKCQSLVKVENPDDRWCLARSIVIGLAYQQLVHNPRTNFLKNGGIGGIPEQRRNIKKFKEFCEIQDTHDTVAQNLMKSAGVFRNKQWYGLTDITKFDQFLGPRVRLVIFAAESQCRILYKSEKAETNYDLALVLDKKHFSFISKPSQLFKVNLFSGNIII
jgi:hypothetical protein